MRVTAIRSLKGGILETYGSGILMERQVPDISPFKEVGLKNPCIKLDTGKYVWGYECWWGEEEKFDNKYKDVVTETIIVEPPNTQPVKKE